MAIGFSDILSVLQNGVTAINNLRGALNNVFPQSTATSSLAPAAGVVTFTSSQANIFISVTTSSGGVYKVPGY
jgi:hypothetical protein